MQHHRNLALEAGPREGVENPSYYGLARMGNGPLDHFRAFARRPVGLSAIVSRGDGSWKRPARLIDLGLGGACMEMLEAVPNGTAVSLSVEAPHLWDPLFLQGEVVWLHSIEGAARLGVRFYHRSGRTLRTLTELLEAEAYH